MRSRLAICKEHSSRSRNLTGISRTTVMTNVDPSGQETLRRLSVVTTFRYVNQTIPRNLERSGLGERTRIFYEVCAASTRHHLRKSFGLISAFTAASVSTDEYVKTLGTIVSFYWILPHHMMTRHLMPTEEHLQKNISLTEFMTCIYTG